ncbi:hypothetical protein B0H34DRAFT_236423 [Crassisporium funariophilum]|nr:hypothetical protein B0H34DRAFT_236423 [Crassisporium funariophilum]
MMFNEPLRCIRRRSATFPLFLAVSMESAAAAFELVQEALMSPHERIEVLLDSLPMLGKDNVILDDSCPICLMPFSSILAEECDEEPEMGGVTKLLGCGHVFCRRDLTEWIRSRHGSCPTCRHTFLNILPPSESDDESSDGGEYIPNPLDFDEEDEDVFPESDGFSEADDFAVEEMDLDFDEIWEDEHSQLFEGHADAADLADEEMGDEDEDEDDAGSEWGLTDGESESMSSFEGGSTKEDDEPPVALEMAASVSVSVHEGEDANGAEGEGLDVELGHAGERK